MTGLVVQWMAERKLALVASVACAVLCAVLLKPHVFGHRKPTLRMSAGPSQTRRHAVAEYLTRQAAAKRLSIQLVDTAGSEDCLQQIKAGRLDAGVVCSGLVIPHDDDIMVVGALQMEAVHVLVRPEIAEVGLAVGLRGKRINIGAPGSTEWLLSRDFLQFVGLRLPTSTQPGDVVPTELSKEELLRRARAIASTTDAAEKAKLIAEMPECVVFLATLPSQITQTLIQAVDYRLVPLPAARAFLLDNLQEQSSTHTVIEREFMEPMAIPAHSYFVRKSFPEADCETVGVRMLLVAHRKAPAAAIRPLMQTLFEGEFTRRIQPKSPRDLATPYAIHPAAIAYLDRDKPLLVRELFESLSKLLSIFGVISAAALSLYGLLWRKKTRKPADYYAEIRKLDQLASGAPAEGAAVVPPQELAKYLDDRLLQLRHELIADVCDGRLEGDQVVANILGLLADSRQNLPQRAKEISPPSRVVPARRAA